MENFYVSEGNLIGGQEPQPHGTTQTKITASVAVTKGDLIEVTGDFTVGPAASESTKVCGIAQNTAAIGEYVVISTEGFVKLDASAAVIGAGVSVVSAGSGKIKASAGTGKVVGITIAGCSASGVAYVKFSV